MSLLAEALARLQSVGNQQYAGMPFWQLAQMRESNPSQSAQNIIAPYEHRAFTREVMQESPLAAAISMPFMIPGYSAGKAIATNPVTSSNPMMAIPHAMLKNYAQDLGLHKSRSQPSLEEMKQAYIGYGEGLLNLLK